MSGKMIRESWDANAARWIDVAREGRMPSRTVTSPAILNAAAALAPDCVLDLGCGEGWLARALTEKTGAQVTGIDTSAALIKAAQAEDPKNDYRVLAYEDAAADPARLGGPYDLVIANFALFDEDLTPVLRAIAQALTPQGRLLIQTLHPSLLDPQQDGWRTEKWDRFAGEGWTDMPLYLRTMEGWKAVLDKAGFELTETIEPRDSDGAPLSIIFAASKESPRPREGERA